MWVLEGFLEQQVRWELQVLLLDADLLGLEGCQLETEAGCLGNQNNVPIENTYQCLPATPKYTLYNWPPSIPMWVLKGFLEQQVC